MPDVEDHRGAGAPGPTAVGWSWAAPSSGSRTPHAVGETRLGTGSSTLGDRPSLERVGTAGDAVRVRDTAESVLLVIVAVQPDDLEHTG